MLLADLKSGASGVQNTKNLINLPAGLAPIRVRIKPTVATEAEGLTELTVQLQAAGVALHTPKSLMELKTGSLSIDSHNLPDIDDSGGTALTLVVTATGANIEDLSAGAVTVTVFTQK